MAETTVQDTGATVTISEACAKQVCALVAEGEHAGMMLRVSVGGGGCSGFQYSFEFDDTRNEDDHLIERDGAKVLIDGVSWDFLIGSEVHYEQELVGAWFTVRNPNATSTCGCGTSFAIG